MPRDPLVLGFDTSAAHCAAALLCGERVLARAEEDMGRGQAERLMPMLEELLSEAGVTWSDLGAIGVGVGPGNFTGIRIAVSAARGLAMSLGIPAVGVSSFEALAEGRDGPVLAIVAAPRGMSYMQLLGDHATGPDLVEGLAVPAQMRAPGLTCIGAQAEEAAQNLGASAAAPAHPLAVAIARVALARRNDRPARPAPLYLRAADAAPAADQPPVILDDA
ncbi:tRNA (adenosine(37)-N6)-threonylcarbamoyltransferase complex dimerization subunit type 1 TsaB [Actibacterium sp. MT2.3-13A]|uniref:tRNA (adenosine(37)-N6)-threonylcarbamoyltransferase complex dimerization subunit type 1 TsaB n=1 Tax=Actibacterium sp. MT2.3-13A TaxID=2828332 RepID=UPI001BA73E6C|nr:tRNA (adenosine(37)-N6)-threonylcarbamoyltransferase complex dimerization subunit type 1 TsaB [Actibacterium sp. MT2.3-13A]